MESRLVGINRTTRHGSDSLDHSFWVQPKIATVDLGSQRGSETMSHSPDNHHDLAGLFLLSCVGRRAPTQVVTRASGSVVGVCCYEQVLQSRAHCARKCASRAQSQTQPQSTESATGGDLCRKFSRGCGNRRPGETTRKHDRVNLSKT